MFFKVSKFKLYSLVVVIAISAFTLSPAMFSSLINGTTIMNWLLVGLMLLVVVIMVIECIVTANEKDQ